MDGSTGTLSAPSIRQIWPDRTSKQILKRWPKYIEKKGGGLPPPQGSPHLLLAAAVVHHAVLGGHGRRAVEGGGVEGHLLDLGDAVGDVGHAQALGLIPVPPVLEELLEERRFAHLRQDLHLGVFGVVHLRDEVYSHLHRRLALVDVGVFAWREDTW